MFFGVPFYGPDLAEGFELLGCVCRPTTCAGESGMKDRDGVYGEEMSEVELRDDGRGAEENFSGIIFGKRFLDAVDMADIVTGFPFQR